MSEPTAPERNAAEDSAQHHDPANSETTDIVQGLASTAQTMSSSLQNMQQALLANMQQAAQMTMSMNMMMEELVKRAVQVGVHTERLRLSSNLSMPSDTSTSSRPWHRCTLRVAINNRSPIPLLKVTTKLWFSKRALSQSPTTIVSNGSGTQDRADESQIEISPQSRSSDDKPTTLVDREAHLLAFSSAQGVLPEAVDTRVEPLVQGSLEPSSYLPSGATASATLVLSVGKLEQLNGTISVEFVSPGTGETLSIVHRFGIRLLHLVDCSYVAAAEAGPALSAQQLDGLPGIPTVSVGLGRIREVFAVSPAAGIAPGALLLFTPPHAGYMIGLRIGSISHDSQSAVCKWISSISDNQVMLSLVPRLAEELTA
ncbi:hypothetical protein IW152_005601 [Coemansia sp. BCRC 34962]|nr:hypothetical protein IW152_005601 [Coemansia sp. BCRC 34962]